MAKKLKIVEMGLHELSPYANNPRKNKKAVDAVAASIAEFGFKVPIVADSSGEIIAGHTRYKAAKKLGLGTVPVIIADDLSEDQIKAFRLADNKVGELAEWDLDKLVAELEGIELDMEQFGFEDLDLDKEPIEEDFYEPEPPDEPKAKPGQIWMLGKHRLMCGDSTSERDISKLMSGAQADLVITDPPYNVNYEGSAKELKHKKIENDSMADSCFHDFLLDFYNLMLLYLKAGGYFIFGTLIAKEQISGARLKKPAHRCASASYGTRAPLCSAVRTITGNTNPASTAGKMGRLITSVKTGRNQPSWTTRSWISAR